MILTVPDVVVTTYTQGAGTLTYQLAFFAGKTNGDLSTAQIVTLTPAFSWKAKSLIDSRRHL
jgi:hypothetical protein